MVPVDSGKISRERRLMTEVRMDDMLKLYQQASEWTTEKVGEAATKLDDRTPCTDWDVRTLLNHMLDTQRYFAGSARGDENVSPPSPNPPSLIGDDPRADFEAARREVVDTFSQPGVIDRTGPSLGIAFSDQLLHGWDLARATQQDATMPDGLAEAAYTMIHGRFTDDQRKGIFKPEITVADDAPAQAKLLAYTGRDPQA
jgi:uncharacterized protein (TIGR03086 family)